MKGKTRTVSTGAAAPREALNVESARELDDQGVRAFREGRYRDALEYFRMARRIGGPVLELWNVARCHEKLDDAEQAAEVLEEYLRDKSLPSGDRSEAERVLRDLRARSSFVSVVGNPNGAQVTVDGRLMGKSPLTLELPPGGHAIEVKKDGHGALTKQVDLQFGRAHVVAFELLSTR